MKHVGVAVPRGLSLLMWGIFFEPFPSRSLSSFPLVHLDDDDDNDEKLPVLYGSRKATPSQLTNSTFPAFFNAL